MFDSLTKLSKGKNINQKMALRKQVEESEDPECRDHAVIRVSQIKEQLEAAMKNEKVVMATLNSLPGSWDSFI